MLPRGNRTICMISAMFLTSRLELYYTDPAHLITAADDLDDLDRHLSHLSIRPTRGLFSYERFCAYRLRSSCRTARSRRTSRAWTRTGWGSTQAPRCRSPSPRRRCSRRSKRSLEKRPKKKQKHYYYQVLRSII